jgi:hypothetical protein
MNDSPPKWTESYIQQLVETQVQENIELDYKACAALAKTDGKKNDISKDVSAFANSAGGTIIYGVCEDNETHLPTKIDDGFHPKDISKEWLEQVVNSTIKRRIDGVRVHPVPLSNERLIYVVTIPSSIQAPHMASDRRYYKRFNFESVPMEEYEVRDVARRNEAPDLWIEFEATARTDSAVRGVEEYFVSLNARITNRGPAMAEHYVVTIYVDESVGVQGLADKLLFAKSVVAKQGRLCRQMEKSCGVSRGHMPIWEGAHVLAMDPPITVRLPAVPKSYLLGWKLMAPKMAVKESFAWLIHSSGGFTIEQPNPDCSPLIQLESSPG